MNASSETMPSYVRAATALRAVCLQLDQRSVTHEMIERAKQAVKAWANDLH
jgi:hypothetical protein